MTRLMEKAFEKARELPEDEQDAIASIILQEIESEHRWDELFSHPIVSAQATEWLASARATPFSGSGLVHIVTTIIC